jgi:hypothetical protein
MLAGDYVDTGLPATIEGAIRSGLAAAEAISHSPGARIPIRQPQHENAKRSDDGGTVAGQHRFALARPA